MPIEDQRTLRLHQIARALGLNVDDLTHPSGPDSSAAQQCLELFDCYRKITDAEQRERLLAYARALAAAPNAQSKPSC